jgi:hypothetical protein
MFTPAHVPSPLDRLLGAFDDAAGVEAERVLTKLRAAHDRGEWREDLPPLGDFYVALSDEADDAGDGDAARRLRAAAVGLPASEPHQVIGAHLADGYDDDRAGQLAKLRAAAEGLQTAETARLLAAFAESIEDVDPETAETLLEEALPLAVIALHAGDEPTYSAVIVPRALLRSDLDKPSDAHDLAADERLAAIAESMREGPLPGTPPEQAFLPVSEYEEAARRWPDDYATGPEYPAAFYGELEQHYRAAHADYQQSLTLQPVTLAFADAHGVGLNADDIDAPEEFWQQLSAEHPPIAWPPGRNDACWCGSGRKYKRCCATT